MEFAGNFEIKVGANRALFDHTYVNGAEKKHLGKRMRIWCLLAVIFCASSALALDSSKSPDFLVSLIETSNDLTEQLLAIASKYEPNNKKVIK